MPPLYHADVGVVICVDYRLKVDQRSLFYLRWLMTHLQDETADQLEVKGR